MSNPLHDDAGSLPPVSFGTQGNVKALSQQVAKRIKASKGGGEERIYSAMLKLDHFTGVMGIPSGSGRERDRERETQRETTNKSKKEKKRRKKSKSAFCVCAA
jgi:hypothetical protein